MNFTKLCLTFALSFVLFFTGCKGNVSNEVESHDDMFMSNDINTVETYADDNIAVSYLDDLDEFINAEIGDIVTLHDVPILYDYSGNIYDSYDFHLTLQGMNLVIGRYDTWTKYMVEVDADGRKIAVPKSARVCIYRLPDPDVELVTLKGIIKYNEVDGGWLFYILYEDGDSDLPVIDSCADTEFKYIEFNGMEYKVHPIALTCGAVTDFQPEKGKTYMAEIKYEAVTIQQSYGNPHCDAFNYFYVLNYDEESA